MSLSSHMIHSCLSALGFTPQSGRNGFYFKSYPNHDSYTICADMDGQTIEYCGSSSESGIIVSEKTTSNFSQAENLVVLECVDRLLRKGYPPASIELEKNYPSGRGSIRLDILVRRADGTPFLMIECKTWGQEYEKERNRMLKNGGQLFSYYSMDRDAACLCLYTSRVENGEAECRYATVDVDEAWRDLSGVAEIVEHWNKTFRDNGIFESYAAPYAIHYRALICGDLKSLGEEDSGKIYNQIMEILRHNAISDKPNAFNKLLNLFVCKIIDEDRNPEEELLFQWRGEEDSDEELQLRLNDLYKDGMWRFLEIKVTDHKREEVLENLERLDQLGADSKTRAWIWQLYTDSRLKKSPNFAFVEVQDDRTFALNAKVVREMVVLLQGYKFRYEQKHEFLGNFFELLLNTSMKQEAGQFFTPVPITRFLISALPLRELVQERLNSREKEPLPAVIDYACGSGHFLTEYMSQMQDLIDSGQFDLSRAAPSVRSRFQSWQGFTKFLWAKDRVYGIDLDNRLVKTAKVSAFFNGDGEASIIWANGLDHFVRSPAYRGLLRHTRRDDPRDNGSFDILISNPPYSVDAFRNTIRFGKESFALYPCLTSNSSEIECLFVERMKQLLRVGGWAAVILPSSILTNGGIHARAREILLRYFRFRAVVELGGGTFMETNTNTVALFLERRGNGEHETIQMEVDRFFATKADTAASGLEHAFSAFVSQAYDRITFADYVSLFSAEPTAAMRNHELYRDYVRDFGDDYRPKAAALEKEKIVCFLLTQDQEIVVVKTGKKQAEKRFLGYEFSKRRGHEGLHPLPGGTMLYDEADPLNPKKAAGYIYRSFLGKRAEVDECLRGNVFYGRLSGFLEYGTSRFDKMVQLGKRQTDSTFAEREGGTPLGDIVQCNPSKAELSGLAGDMPVSFIEMSSVSNDGYVLQTEERQLAGVRKGSYTYFRNNDIIIAKITPCMENGKCALVENLTNGIGMGSSEFHVLRCGEKILPRYLFYFLNRDCIRIEAEKVMTGKSGHRRVPIQFYQNLKIPLPPLDIQRRIAQEIQALEAEGVQLQTEIHSEKVSLQKDSFFSSTPRRIGDLAVMIKRGKAAKYGSSDIQIIKSGQARGYLEFDFSERYFVSEGFVSDQRNLEKGDLLINSTGVGTAGRVTLFEMEGRFVADSHITIVRLDQSLVLPRYALYALGHFGFKNIEAMAMGQSGQIELALDAIRDISIPLPPMEEQRRIVAEIREHEAEIDRLTARMKALAEEKEAVLKKYLS